LASTARVSAGLASIQDLASVSASIHALITGRLARAQVPSEIQNGEQHPSPADRSGSPSATLPAAISAPANGSSASTASTLPALSWSPMLGNGTLDRADR
jgi:hypothetical protein